jgi:hypothetical protein
VLKPHVICEQTLTKFHAAVQHLYCNAALRGSPVILAAGGAITLCRAANRGVCAVTTWLSRGPYRVAASEREEDLSSGLSWRPRQDSNL